MTTPLDGAEAQSAHFEALAAVADSQFEEAGEDICHAQFHIIVDGALRRVMITRTRLDGRLGHIEIDVQGEGRYTVTDEELGLKIEARRFPRNRSASTRKILPKGFREDFHGLDENRQMDVIIDRLERLIKQREKDDLQMSDVAHTHKEIAGALAQELDKAKPHVVVDANEQREIKSLTSRGTPYPSKTGAWTVSRPSRKSYIASANLGQQDGNNQDAAYVDPDQLLIVDGVSGQGDASTQFARLSVGFAVHADRANEATETLQEFSDSLARIARLHPETHEGLAALVMAKRVPMRVNGQLVKTLPDGGSIWDVIDEGDSRWYVIGADGQIIDENEMHNDLGKELADNNVQKRKKRRTFVQWLLDHTDQIEGKVDPENDGLIKRIVRHASAMGSTTINKSFPRSYGGRTRVKRIYCPPGATLYACTDGVDDLISPVHVGHLRSKGGIAKTGNGIIQVVDENRRGVSDQHMAKISPAVRRQTGLAMPRTIVGFSGEARKKPVWMKIGRVRVPKGWSAPGPKGPEIDMPNGDHSTFGLLET